MRITFRFLAAVLCCGILAVLHAPAPAADQIDPVQLVRHAEDGNLDAVKELLAAGVDVDIRRHDGTTALMAAAAGGHTGIVRALLDAGADARRVPSSRWSPLFNAVVQDHLDIAAALLAAGASPDVAPANYGGGRTPLMVALSVGNVKMARLLLEGGASLHATTSYGATPLWFSVWNDSPEQQALVRDMLAAGANVDAGQQPSYRFSVKLRSAEGTVLGSVAHNDQPHYLRMFLAAGAKVDARQVGWRTPLMIAAAAGRAENVRLLLKAGAAPEATDSDGRTALMHAEAGRHAEVVRLLSGR